MGIEERQGQDFFFKRGVGGGGYIAVVVLHVRVLEYNMLFGIHNCVDMM